MLQPALLVQPQAAVDPVGWIIAAIILFNLLSPLFARRRSKAQQSRTSSQLETSQPVAAPVQQSGAAPVWPPISAPLSPPTPSSAAAPARQSLQPSAARRLTAGRPQSPSALSDEERERLRQALAAGGVTVLAAELQRRSTQARKVPITPAPVAASLSLPAPALPPPPQPDGLTLMTLESGTTAFNQLPSALQLPMSAAAPAVPMFARALFSSPRAAAGAFVAAAVVGPCAALRPLGHTPAGW